MATWNVALWINNDQHRYEQAVNFMTYHRKLADLGFPMKASKYQRFVEVYGLDHTPDGYSYTDESLDIKALDEMMQEL
jgi:hypothetical protein